MHENKRVILAKLVRKHKEQLFAPFSHVITRQFKENLWESIRKEAVANSYLALANKNWKEVRDNYWSAMRRDFISKVDKYRKLENCDPAVSYTFNEVFSS